MKPRSRRARFGRSILNIIQDRPKVERWYCFTTVREGTPNGPWRIAGECVSADWMDAVWRDYIVTPIGSRVNEATNGQPFDDFVNLGDLARSAIAWSWRWFLDQLAAPRNPPLQMRALEMLHEPSAPWQIELEEWYEIELAPTYGGGSNLIRCYMTELFQSDDGDDQRPQQTSPMQWEVRSVRTVYAGTEGREITRCGLHVFHTLEGLGMPDPQIIGGNDGGQDPQPVPIQPNINNDFMVDENGIVVFRVAVGLVRRIRQLIGRAVAFFRDWTGGGFAPALASGVPLAMPMPRADERPKPLPAAAEYCGAPAAALGGQIANPAINGRVAVLDVGQGNCNAIFDAAGNIVAYYDMGWPWGTMETSRPDAPVGPLTRTRPCVCTQPIVILSHRDLDHYRRALLRGRVCKLTWLMPTGGGQHIPRKRDSHGTYFTTLLKRIKDHGGEIVGWRHNAPNPGYMAFPWGFVERCTGASVNSSGLAAWVCLRDDPAVERARAAVGAIAGQLPMGMPPAVAVFARVAVAAVAGGAAAALAGETPQRLALAAVRAAASVVVLGAVSAVASALDVNSANAFGFGTTTMAAAGGAFAGGLAAEIGAAVWAAHGVGLFGTDAARCAAVAPTVANGLSAGVLLPVVAPIAANGDNGLSRERGASARAARAALAAVALNVPVGAPLNTLLYAEVVAAALGYNAGAAVAANDAAIAAIRAVISVLNGDAIGTTRTRINSAHGLNCFMAQIGNALGVTRRNNTAAAAVAVVAVGPAMTAQAANDRAVAAAGVFPGSSEHAVRAAGEPNADLTVRAGRPPFAPGERYALLTGDADFYAVPSAQPVNNPLPMVVGMTAMHHGSFIEDGRFIEFARIPWAPGSAEAASAQTAAVGAHSLAESIRAVTDSILGVGLPNLKADLTHAGASAASAIFATHAYLTAHAQHRAVAVLTGDYSRAFASSAAVTVVTARNAPAEAGEVGLAAVHAAATRIGAGYTYDFAQAAQAARAEFRNNGLLFREVRSKPVMLGGLWHGSAARAQVGNGIPVPGGAPANSQRIAEGIAAAADQFVGGSTAQQIADASLRLAIGLLQYNKNRAVDEVYTAHALGCGCGNVAATPRRQRISWNDLQKMVEWGESIRPPHFAAYDVARLAGVAAAPLVGQMLNNGGAMMFGAGGVVQMLAPAFAVADNTGLTAAVAAQAAMRATVSAMAGGNVATIAGEINSGNQMISAAFVDTLANVGGGPIGADAARGLAVAAKNVAAARGNGGYLALQLEAKEAAMSFNQATAWRIQEAVRAVKPPLATPLVSVPGVWIGNQGAVGVVPLNVRTTVKRAAAYGPEGHSEATLIPRDRSIVYRLARAAVAAQAAVPGTPNECNAAEGALNQPLANAANVQAVMALAANAPWGNAIADVARMAAYYAMVGEAERRSAIPGSRIVAAIEAVARGTVDAATEAGNLNAGQGASAIVYSYGIMPPNHHCYTNSTTLGGYGHPHPLAVDEYIARGWTRRHNTSMRANHGGPQGDGVSPRGHAAIEWDAVNDAPRAAGNAQVHCAVCGQRIRIEH